jgi:hypothetical protein
MQVDVIVLKDSMEKPVLLKDFKDMKTPQINVTN